MSGEVRSEHSKESDTIGVPLNFYTENLIGKVQVFA